MLCSFHDCELLVCPCFQERTQALIVTILLLTWQPFFSLEESSEYDIIEYFAGVGRIARLASSTGLKAGAYDWEFGKTQEKARPSKKGSKQSRVKRPMDLTSSAGFLLLGFTCLIQLVGFLFLVSQKGLFVFRTLFS